MPAVHRRDGMSKPVQDQSEQQCDGTKQEHCIRLQRILKTIRRHVKQESDRKRREERRREVADDEFATEDARHVFQTHARTLRRVADNETHQPPL